MKAEMWVHKAEGRSYKMQRRKTGIKGPGRRRRRMRSKNRSLMKEYLDKQGSEAFVCLFHIILHVETHRKARGCYFPKPE